MLDPRCWMLDTVTASAEREAGCWMLDTVTASAEREAGYWMLDTGHCERGARSRILDARY